MLVVLKVETRTVDRNWYEIALPLDHFPKCIGAESSNPRDDTCTIEGIQGYDFVTEDGELVTIGMTKEVQGVLGVPMDSISDLHRRLHKSDDEHYLTKVRLQNASEILSDAQKTINGYETMSVAGRVVFLFVGLQDGLITCGRTIKDKLIRLAARLGW